LKAKEWGSLANDTHGLSNDVITDSESQIMVFTPVQSFCVSWNKLCAFSATDDHV